MLTHLPMIGDDPPVSSYPFLLSPQSIHLRLSAECSSDCPMCERENWKTGDKQVEHNMDRPVIDMLFEKFVPGVRGVELAGLGEPTLSKHFAYTAKRVVEAGKILYFPTNGQFLDRKHVYESVGPTPRISVSIDASDEESYSRMRPGKGTLASLIKNVKALKAHVPGVVLHSQFTADIRNIDCLPGFMRICADLGIKDVILRLTQHHATSREDYSLRFARDRTKRNIEAARTVAQEAGIWFIAEERSYSPTNPNSLDKPDANSDQERLHRYIDFVPMGFGPNCPVPSGGTTHIFSGITPTYIYTPNTSSPVAAVNIINPAPNVIDFAEGDISTFITSGFNQDSGLNVLYDLGANAQVIDRSSASYKIDESGSNTVTCTLYGSTTGLLGSWTSIAASSGPTSAWHSFSGGGGSYRYYQLVVTTASGAASEIASVGDFRLFDLMGNDISKNHTSLSGGGFGGLAISGPTIIRSRTARRGPAKIVQAVQYSDAALIAFADGRLCSCFAEHPVGNIEKDTLDSVIRNPRYQAFLQRRMDGSTVDSEPWCRNCARTF